MAESALNVIDTLRNKITEILSRPNNRELEIDFRTTCSAIQNNSYDPLVMQAYQDYLNAYRQKTSLYNVARDYEDYKYYLYIYNTETEEVKKLQATPPLSSVNYLAQLPNGKLFCFGNDGSSGTVMLIGENGGVEALLSCTPSQDSSCIYFSNSIYCFGGLFNRSTWTLSRRFDLDQNRWIQLSPMPKADSKCNSIIFNGNILISGWNNRNLLLYSIDIDSFSTIPYEFEEKKWKILINAERLYLIECLGWIYESEIGSAMNWGRIGKSKINSDSSQVYCAYNKGGIYISTVFNGVREYYHFDLDQKNIIDLAYESKNYGFRRVGKKIEAIKWNNQNFKPDPYYLDEWSVKGMSLHDLGKHLEVIIYYDELIKKYPDEFINYYNKGITFYSLERYLEAIECYNEAIKLEPNISNNYYQKGNAFYSLKRYLEAIECYDGAIKLDPKYGYYYHDKGKAFYGLERYLEAIECYEKAIEFDSYNVKCYNDKGNTLYVLERYQEAIQSYDEAIKLQPKNPSHFCTRARVFNNLRQEEAALQDFNTAYNLWQQYQESDAFAGNEWKLSEEDIKFINDILGETALITPKNADLNKFLE
ncbi:unnamed protein product [Blepharisma stoltei]|uniref:Tetratricopeptide repeat protein n=1 Tax=Blepharisma stoltei TaxID=1481888 RepID=A0AAU9JB14_9CILI|nr:unnamed protein product [Blepharisma stoltei]